MYTPAAVGKLVGLHRDRVRRWLLGYEYSYTVQGTRRKKTQRQGPVVRRRGTEGTRHASFFDLIDLVFVKRFLDHGLSLQKLRASLAEASDLLGAKHFARETFFTDGKRLFLQVQNAATGADSLMQLLSGGQWGIAPVIKQVARQIDFSPESGYATRWYPLGKSKPIVLDPSIAFGAPSLREKAVKTATVYDIYHGENRNVDKVAEWMNLSKKEVAVSVEFEESLRAAC